jgi:hypothetical protein
VGKRLHIGTIPAGFLYGWDLTSVLSSVSVPACNRTSSVVAAGIIFPNDFLTFKEKETKK